MTFKSEAAYVRLDVQVLDGNRPVIDLTPRDFVIADEGEVQPISYFGREREPLDLLLLLDVSGSMSKFIEQMAGQARSALRFLRRDDRVAVMAFGRGTHLRLPFTVNLDDATADLRMAVRDDTVGSGTAINSAILAAVASIRAADQDGARRGRRAILMLTDNFCLNYRVPDQDVIRQLEAANTVLNAIVVGRGHRPPPPRPDQPLNPDFTPADVFLLADTSGGEAIKAERADAAFSGMIERIRTRYTLQYKRPEAARAGYRRVRVTLAEDARKRYPHAEVLSRRGYLAG